MAKTASKKPAAKTADKVAPRTPTKATAAAAKGRAARARTQRAKAAAEAPPVRHAPATAKLS